MDGSPTPGERPHVPADASWSVHPDCPDAARLGPDPLQGAIRARAAAIDAAERERRRAWERGFTRRTALAGAGMAGVAALGAQLVTARYAFGAPADRGRVLIVIFMRGGMDGLSVVVPAGDPAYQASRPQIGVAARQLIGRDGIFGLHPALKPLLPYWRRGRFGAVHAVGTPDRTRSHFSAQDVLERGSPSTGVTSGWLDRVLAALGPGTTFRAVAEGGSLPRSMAGTEAKLVLRGVGNFRLQGYDGVAERTKQALRRLYTGLDHPLEEQALGTLRGMALAARIAGTEYEPAPGVEYPTGGFGDGLRDIARLIKSGAGLRVAALDLGGWDMHTALGNVDGGAMRGHLEQFAAGLAGFATDLGDRFEDVTVVTMSEFGRRVEQNGNAGTDHGYGGAMLLLGGGVVGGRVHGRWPGLAADRLDLGDLAGPNDYRDVLGEIVSRRMGASRLDGIFPGHRYRPLGIIRD